MTVEDCTPYLVPPLPDLIISDILTRLPAKTITRFKTVSKSWHSLISTHHFISSYASRNPPSWVILNRVIRINPNLINTINFTFSDPPDLSSFSIKNLVPDTVKSNGGDSSVVINGCDGLLLFALKRSPHKDGRFNVFVCNPITRQFVYLPDSGHDLGGLGAIGFSTRVMGPSGSGLDFVIVVFQPFIGTKTSVIMTFNSQIWKWEKKVGNFDFEMPMWRSDGSFELNGSIYFVDLSFGLVALDEPFNIREKFDLRCISLPYECTRIPNPSGLDESRCIGVSGGYIQLFEVVKEWFFTLWRFEDREGGEWKMVSKVKMVDVLSNKSYLDRILPKDVVPECGFLHPLKENVVVLKAEKSVIAVDVSEKKVVSFRTYWNKDGNMLFMPFVIPSWPTSIPPSMIAVSEKDCGNEYFKKKRFNEALSCYSRSIISSPTALGYANRAATYLELNRYQEAESDCMEALKLDDNYMKAYARRAIARKELGKLGEAKEDAELALKLEPQHPEVLKQFTEINFLLEKKFPGAIFTNLLKFFSFIIDVQTGKYQGGLCGA